MMTMRGGDKPRSPHDHRSRPYERSRSRAHQHIDTSQRTALRDTASIFKTAPEVGRYRSAFDSASTCRLREVAPFRTLGRYYKCLEIHYEDQHSLRLLAAL